MFIFRKIRELLYARQVDVLSAAMILGASALASRVLGLVRDRVLTHYFTGEQISVYFAAFRFPDTLFEILVLGALSAAFIPTFISYISGRKEEEAWRVTSIIMNLSLIFFVSLAALVFIFAVPFSNLIAPGFSSSEISLMAKLTRILLFTQGFFVLSFFLTGALKSYQRFFIPAIAPILYNLGIIGGTVVLGPTLGIFSPAWGAVVGALMHFAVQLPLAIRLGFKPVLSLDYKHSGVRRVIRLAAPRVLELGFLQILKASELFFASIISTASYAYLTFAQHLEMLPVALFGLSLADAALPALSYKRSSSAQFRKTFFSVFRQIIFFTLPVAAAFIVLRIPLVRLAFGASKFTWESTVLTGYALSMFALGIAGQALTLYFVRTFYALRNTLIPVVIGIADIFLNIGLVAYFVLVLELPVWGIALAFALSALVQAFTLWVFLIKKLHFSVKDFVLPLFKVILASLASGGVMYLMLKIFDRSAWDKNLSFLGKFGLPERFELFVLDTRYTASLVVLTAFVGVVGILVYLGVCRVLRVEEVKLLSQIWKRILSFPKTKVPAPTVEDEH